MSSSKQLRGSSNPEATTTGVPRGGRMIMGSLSSLWRSRNQQRTQQRSLRRSTNRQMTCKPRSSL
jgi:hypothetical protein